MSSRFLLASICSLLSASGVLSNGLTIYNKCPGLKVYANNNAVPSRCLNGKVCTDYNNQAAVMMFASTGPWATTGCQTEVEVTGTGGTWWYDISRIKGFNVAAKMDYQGNNVDCTSPNCESKEAYKLCDVQQTDPEGALRNAKQGGTMSITFCPDGHTGVSKHCCASEEGQSSLNNTATTLVDTKIDSPWLTDIPFGKKIAGEATYYNDAGYGACGTEIDASSQKFVAIPHSYWTAANPNADPLCSKVCISVSYNGKEVTGIPVRDKCPSCDTDHIDLSEPVFAEFASTSVGVLKNIKYKFTHC